MQELVVIVENNIRIREAKLQRISGGLYLIVFPDGGGIQVKSHRFFSTREEAKQCLLEQYRNKKSCGKTLYDFRV